MPLDVNNGRIPSGIGEEEQSRAVGTGAGGWGQPKNSETIRAASRRTAADYSDLCTLLSIKPTVWAVDGPHISQGGPSGLSEGRFEKRGQRRLWRGILADGGHALGSVPAEGRRLGYRIGLTGRGAGTDAATLQRLPMRRSRESGAYARQCGTRREYHGIIRRIIRYIAGKWTAEAWAHLARAGAPRAKVVAIIAAVSGGSRGL